MLEALARSGKYDFYFDGCKNPVRAELLRTEIDNLKMIQMVRHPAAYVYHFYQKGERREEYRLNQWLHYHKRVRPFRELLGDKRYLAVTYEHVVKDPGGFLRLVSEFLDMPEIYDDPPGVLRRSAIHIQGNKMRRTADRVLNMADKWKGNLPPDAISMADDTLSQVPWARDLLKEPQ